MSGITACGLEDFMPVRQYQNWFDACCNGDADAVEHTLIAATKEERDLLLNGLFDYRSGLNNTHRLGDHGGKGNVQLPQRPFSLTAVCGAHATLKVMLGYPINSCLSDPKGNNVIHELVRFAGVSRKCEVIMAETFSVLLQLMPTTEFERLLRTESNDRLRPLELAAKLSTLRMYNVIVQTPGIYLAKVEKDGPLIRKWYDLTEYESYEAGNRRDVSPVTFLLDLRKSDLYSDECLALLSQAPTRHWIDTKLRMNMPFIFAWFLFRLVYLIVFIVCDNSDFARIQMKTNTSMRCATAMFTLPKWADMTTTVYLFAHSLLILMVDIFDALCFLLPNGRWGRWRTESLISGRNVALHHNFYRFCQFVFVFMVMLRVTARLFSIYKLPFMVELTEIGICLVMPWTILYFVQLVPYLGYFTVSIQKMFRDLLHFMVVFVILLIPLSYLLHTMVNTFSEQGCIPQFNSPWRSAYTSFTVILNMVDFTSFRLHNPVFFYLLHVVFVFSTSFLLINFLIALMSNSVNQISDHKYVTMLVQRLSVAMLTESRAGRLLKRYYIQRQQKCFVCCDAHVYVVDHCTRYDTNEYPQATKP